MTSVLRRMAFGVLALLFGAGAVFGAVQPVNAVAYLLGLGDEVTVRIEEGSIGSIGTGSRAGVGRILEDGREVRLADVHAGEIVSARTVLIDIGSINHAYHTPAAAATDFLWLIGMLILGGPALLFALAAFPGFGDRVRDA
ncbi:hypothetical protein [Nocardia thailandica]|uniref:hypothetical protein n=1 Tax=Nocardia thailandica TaxID=257275 RepID=UPI00031FB2CA|nr:hypothetical protein [Nocardia thailandica]